MAKGESLSTPREDSVRHSRFPDGIYLDGETPASERALLTHPLTEMERALGRVPLDTPTMDPDLHDPERREAFLAKLGEKTDQMIADGTLPDWRLVPYEREDPFL